MPRCPLTYAVGTQHSGPLARLRCCTRASHAGKCQVELPPALQAVFGVERLDIARMEALPEDYDERARQAEATLATMTTTTMATMATAAAGGTHGH